MNNLKHIEIDENSKEFAYLLGVLLGDGNIQSNKIRIAVKDYDFIRKVAKNLDILGLKRTNITKRKNNGFKRSYLYHVNVYSINLVKIINKNIGIIKQWKNKKQITGFLEGVYDSEGSVDIDRLRIRFSVRDKKFFYLINIFLDKLEINHSLKKIKNRRKIFYTIRIYGEECIRFNNLINFSIKRKRERLKNNIREFYKRGEFEKIKRLETKKLKEKEWCEKYNLTRNQYYRHKKSQIK